MNAQNTVTLCNKVPAQNGYPSMQWLCLIPIQKILLRCYWSVCITRKIATNSVAGTNYVLYCDIVCPIRSFKDTPS